MIGDRDFEHITDKTLRRLAGYWLARRGERAMPARADIDPLDIPWVLARIWLCDYQPAEQRFHFRLAGEKINGYWACSLRGRYLDEVVPLARYDQASGAFLSAVRGPRIVHDSCEIRLADKLFATGERIILPLSDDGETVSGLLGATRRDWFRGLPLEELSRSSQTTTLTSLAGAPERQDRGDLTLNLAP